MTDKQYDDELRGVLFRHDKKGNDRAPDYKGSAQIEHVGYQLSAWIRESKAGAKFMSIAFDRKDDR